MIHSLTSDRSRLVRLLGCVTLLGSTWALPGCLVASSNRVDVSGREVPAAELQAITPGTTTETEVLHKFGPPSSSTAMSDGGIMHLWTATRVERRRGAVLLIFSSTSDKTTRQSVSVVCKGGVVTSVNVD